VRDLGQHRTTIALVPALLTVFLLAGACSGDDSGKRSGSAGRTDGSKEGTLVATKPETTESAPLPEATLGTERDSPGVVLRLEGDPKTIFSGNCAVEGRESMVVISGQVPKRYAFDLRGRRLSCRIQKRNPGEGELKVILTADDTTRSVQQTNSPNSVINVSYASG
jgi:hypothetical protein